VEKLATLFALLNVLVVAGISSSKHRSMSVIEMFRQIDLAGLQILHLDDAGCGVCNAQ
jgi:hypothetical protein